jgi:hypothetical protein
VEKLPALRKVIAVAREIPVGEAKLVLTSLELWSDRTLLNLTRILPPWEEEDPGAAFLEIGLWDDAGTMYETRGSTFGSDGRMMSGHRRFDPVPIQARELTLVVRDLKRNASTEITLTVEDD